MSPTDPFAALKKMTNATHNLVVQQIDCILTASSLDSGAATFVYTSAAAIGMNGSRKPEAVGNVWSITREEYEAQEEAVEDWTSGIRNLGKPGHSRDQLYLAIKGNKIWPSGHKYHEINSGETTHPNLSFPWFDAFPEVTITLMEWDVIKDDVLGEIKISKSDFDASESGQISVSATNEEEGSVYMVHLKLEKRS